MMEWCFSREVDGFVVPRFEELLDQHPSPDIWSRCGFNGSGTFGWPDNFDDSEMTDLPMEENCLRMQFGKISWENCQNGSSSTCGGGSGDSLKRIPAAHDVPNFQLSGSMGADEADDIFLNSLLEEYLPGAECDDNLLYLSPESCGGVIPADSNSTNNVLDMQSIPCDTPTKYFGDQSFSQSTSWDSGEITMPNLTNCHSFDQSDGRQVKALETKLVLPCGQSSSSRCLGEETSLEESVLQELEAVLTQITEKTRLCFRDSLYRLAHNSNEQASVQTRVEGAHDETSSGKTEAGESETNSIDRAVANLMFNKVDANACNLVPAMAAKFVRKPISCNYSWNNEEIVLFPQPSTLSTDTLVPVCVQHDSKANTRFN
ncbi:hypothetical protein Ancab_034648 [Ancistrocladus abbreviatus]